MKRVSCIIPTFDRAAVLERALTSVSSQVLPEGWELETIVVDDGSRDETAAVVERHADRDPRTRLIQLEHCGRPGRVRNVGVRRSDGTAIAFLDSDDEWLPGKLRLQLPLHSHDRAPISHSRERWMRGNREISQAGQRHPRAGDLFGASLRKCVIGPSTVLMLRPFFEEVGGFREDLEIAEDYELWLRVTANVAVAFCDPPLTIKHDGHGDQLSHRYGQFERFRIDALAALHERWVAAPPAPPRSVDPAARIDRSHEELVTSTARELQRKLTIFARGARRRGREAEADLHAARAAAIGVALDRGDATH